MPQSRKPERVVESWEITAVTTLPPGWRNVYEHVGGTRSTTPCPAILIQERHIETRDGSLIPTGETRAMFAAYDDVGCIFPVDDTLNYVRTLGPGEDLL